jgi:hypothetical protein
MTTDIKIIHSWKQDPDTPVRVNHEKAISFATIAFNDEERDDSIVGLWVINNNAGNSALIYTGWDNEDEKYEIFDGFPRFLKGVNATSYSFICEVWVAKRSLDDGKPLGLPAGEDPDREDALQILTESLAGDRLMTTFVCQYPPRSKKPRLLARDDHKDVGHLEGAAVGFFNRIKHDA